ncbi:hypothetical protein ACQB6R_08720 [Propionibacteriaceae bacterium G1746]|uniref:hypothetical protein n=1 Tax=Aestuariimicrobium sp. G57 TaxID=3418485 RepID=UPI003C2028F4
MMTVIAVIIGIVSPWLRLTVGSEPHGLAGTQNGIGRVSSDWSAALSGYGLRNNVGWLMLACVLIGAAVFAARLRRQRRLGAAIAALWTAALLVLLGICGVVRNVVIIARASEAIGSPPEAAFGWGLWFVLASALLLAVSAAITVSGHARAAD